MVTKHKHLQLGARAPEAVMLPGQRVSDAPP
jgi:hypothetical protein